MASHLNRFQKELSRNVGAATANFAMETSDDDRFMIPVVAKNPEAEVVIEAEEVDEEDPTSRSKEVVGLGSAETSAEKVVEKPAEKVEEPIAKPNVETTAKPVQEAVTKPDSETMFASLEVPETLDRKEESESEEMLKRMLVEHAQKALLEKEKAAAAKVKFESP
ncbi:hypothetical protein GCK32_008916 [Trichostrongylus colubriformis]|uniref:Uncharacterized protein n=1 Tax=Trichostrongylus colubriformis TaxID=6319 RepID=A0AAN8FNX0_TRICO